MRLVPSTSDDVEPFVVVHHGRFAKILLAELCGADGVALKRFALKLRADSIDSGGASAPKPPSNAELDLLWHQERAESLRVRSPYVVGPVAVPSALTQSPPVFYCRRVDAYFHPMCPQTGRLLSVCRDDAVLQGAGLSPYGQDTARYLRPQVVEEGAAEVLYHVDGEPHATATARIENLGGLVRAWGRALQGEQVLPDLPCQQCEHRAECYADRAGSLLAEQHLHVLSFYDVDALALELATTGFDTASTWLGGGREDVAEGSGWVNSYDRKGRVVEALRLKLAAFGDVCRGVAALQAAGRPHLGVSPANILAFEDAGSSATPAHWRLRFALTDLGGAKPIEVPTGAGTETIWRPGREVSEDRLSSLFLSPALRSLEGGTVTMTVASSEVVGDDGVARCVVSVHRAGVPSFALKGDLLLIEPADGGPCVGARVDEVSARGLTATVLSEFSDPSSTVVAGGSAHPSWVGQELAARLTFVRRSGPSADLYGLGMILLRLLLVHDEQTLAEVAGAVERCVKVMTSKTGGGDSMPLADRWQEILEGDPGEGRFACWHVMHLRRDRKHIFEGELHGEEFIPKKVWRSLLGLAGRLLLASPLSSSDEAGGGGAPVAPVLEELQRLERLLHVELFEQEARDRCVKAVCAQRRVQLLEEVSEVQVSPETLPPDAAPAALPSANSEGAQPGFVLKIARVGESVMQSHYFAQDRVTIGRREGANLLVLKDPMVSSKHAVIERVDGGYALFDCGSTNGSEVDGIRLPVEVSHPLDDGTVIHIRPFLLSFQLGEEAPDRADAITASSGEEVSEELGLVYAEYAEHGALKLHEEMTRVLDGLQDSLGQRGLLVGIESILAEPGGSGVAVAGAAQGSSDDASTDEQEQKQEQELARAALKSVRQLARSLTDSSELKSAAEVQEFISRVQRFVDVSSRWIEDMLEWRRLFSQQLELRATQTGAVRPPLRTAADVCEELLAPTGDHDGAASSDYFLSRFYDDVLVILEGLVEGGQRMREVVREQLHPDHLVEEAGREAKVSLLVQAAAGSALWKLYRAVYERVTAGSDHEAELRRLLALAAERRHR